MIPPATFTVRTATVSDARAVATLHCDRITEGFLPTLGVRFLDRLYRRVIVAPDGFVYVACDESGAVLGFCATVLDVGALYKRFIVRDGVIAGLQAAPTVLRSWRRVLETLRYPSHSGDLPDAEVLAVAVAAAASGRGIGGAVLAASKSELVARSVKAVKVVAGSHNEGALALYRSGGFRVVEEIEVHEGVRSSVLVWSDDSLAAGPMSAEADA